MLRAIVVAIVLAVIVGIGLAFSPILESSEKRAEAYFENAQELIEAGDADRALIELRNVFKLDGTHRDARLTYAQLQAERGNARDAFSQYLRLVEQYPDDLAGRRALARLAAEASNWDAARTHVEVAEQIAPDDPVVRAIRINLDYRDALLDEDPAAAGKAVEAARTLVADSPDQPLARRVIIDDLIRKQDWEGALDAIDAALARTPERRRLYTLRLGALERLGRDDAIEAQFRDMLQRFPDEGSVISAALRWYVAKGRVDAGEAFLRERIAQSGASADDRMRLVQFLASQSGAEAALAEIESILASEPENPARFRAARAGLRFDQGAREDAISEMRDILKDAEPSEQTNRIRVALARMLVGTGDVVGARAEVEKVLEADPTQVEALKLKAAWLIDDDRTGDALVDLNRALDQSPRDPDIVSLMAEAHKRAGNRTLQGDMLSQAVELSGNAPTESLRYAEFLIADDRLKPAEGVLLDVLRIQPENVSLLGALGNIYVQLADWPRLEGVIDKLSGIDSERTRAIANELTARQLAAQNRADELTSFLEGLASSEQGGLGADIAVIRARLASGDTEAALQRTRSLLEENPGNAALRFIEAQIMAIGGDIEAARQQLATLVGENPENARLRLALYRLHLAEGDREQARTVLDEALAATPNDANLLWAKAGEMERAGDIEGAIAIYERLYEANSNSVVVANNLASLISSYRDDQESLERAYTIARRLRDTDIAPFQDTYGWIAFRLGNHEEALDYLEPAAAALPNEPLAQYHLARAYSALGRNAEALETYGKVIELVGDRTPRPDYLDEVESEIARLGQEATTPAPAAEN